MAQENLDRVMQDLEEMTKEFDQEDSNQEGDVKESDQVEEKEEQDNLESKDNSQNGEVLQLRDTVARLQADFQNYRNRTDKERSSIYKMANESLILKILPVLDNLDRALKAEKEEDSFFQGVTMIRQELYDVIKAEGLEGFDPIGEKFDANLHHAVLMEESDDYESEHVIETFQVGYKLRDKLIRPAMVKVAK